MVVLERSSIMGQLDRDTQFVSGQEQGRSSKCWATLLTRDCRGYSTRTLINAWQPCGNVDLFWKYFWLVVKCWQPFTLSVQGARLCESLEEMT